MKLGFKLMALALFIAAPLSAQYQYQQSRSTDFTVWYSIVEPAADSDYRFTNLNSIDLDSEKGYGAALNIFWSSRFSTEFAAYTYKPAAYSRGDFEGPPVSFGELKMIPITGTLQFHFAPNGRFDPYIGAGVAYVLFDNLKSRDDLGDIDFDSINFEDDYGYVANVGFSFDMTPSIALNVEGKYVPIESAATAVFPDAPGQNFQFKVNPLILSAGISLQF